MIMKMYRPWAVHWIGKDRSTRAGGFHFAVPRGVFHPKLFFSTRFLQREVAQMDLRGRTAIDVGCGAGALSLAMAAAGADVTAVDINPLCVATTIENATANGLSVKALVSDLFAALPDSTFDVVVVNPPYYPRDPVTAEERAWYCGAGMEFFHRFFEQLASHLVSSSTVLMVLSEDCNIDEIGRISDRHGFLMRLRSRKVIWMEENMIFKFERTTRQ